MKCKPILCLTLVLSSSYILSHADESKPIRSTNGDIFQISPKNISDSPISVQVTNVDSSERFTVFYKTDETSDKFLDA